MKNAVSAILERISAGPVLALADCDLYGLDFLAGKDIFGAEQRVTSILLELTTLYHQGL